MERLNKHFRFLIILILLFSLSSIFIESCSDDDGQSNNITSPVKLSPWPGAKTLDPESDAFPEWSFNMHLWPFDILEPTMTNEEIDTRLNAAINNSADTVIFYIESEHMYGTFVDDNGFSEILVKISYLTDKAQLLNLHTIVYLNGLEVMTKGAFNELCEPTGVPTMASEHPDWLQKDLSNNSIVYKCQSEGWLESDWEDAWISPFSGYKDLYKQRISQLATAGVDAVYIDATFLPGYQTDEDNFRWGSSDSLFADAFLLETGFSIPEEEDFSSESFKAFLEFRHTVVANYLKELADTAYANGIIPFWESSTNDNSEGTLLGNETAVTGRSGLGFSPEIEPEGDYVAAFRMAKAARELNHDRPMIYLGWPANLHAANLEFAIALAHSGSYYPTADIEIPENAFNFMDSISHILKNRIPYYGNTVLLYSHRNKDQSFESGAFSSTYEEAIANLLLNHIPFKILPLEFLDSHSLEGIEQVIFPCIAGISDSQAILLNDSKDIAKFVTGCTPGTRDENYLLRSTPLNFDIQDNSSLFAMLPFKIRTSDEVLIEYYSDKDGSKKMYLFIVALNASGKIVISAGQDPKVDIISYSLGNTTQNFSGETISIQLNSYLTVLEISI